MKNGSALRIYVEPPPSQIARDLFVPLKASLRALGHEVSGAEPRRPTSRPHPGLKVLVGADPDWSNSYDLAFVWNGRYFEGGGGDLVVFCAENGWLPRSAYQIGLGGINAQHHAAPWRWTGPLSDAEASDLDEYLELLRTRAAGGAYAYTDPTAEAVDPGEPFLLAPFQMPQDTNMENAPQGLKTPLSFAAAVLDAEPPWRVIFKQHPMDANHENDQLDLAIGEGGEVWPHGRANIHQLLKSEHCRGVVTLNSNVAHDALLWGVSILCLGAGMWPRGGFRGKGDERPHWSGLDLTSAGWESFSAGERGGPQRSAYANWLIRQQWATGEVSPVARRLMRDPGSPEDVAELLEVAG